MSGADDPARALDLLAQALTLPVGERDGFLEQVAGDDPALHGELRALLAADRRAEGFLEPPQRVLALHRAATSSTVSAPRRTSVRISSSRTAWQWQTITPASLPDA